MFVPVYHWNYVFMLAFSLAFEFPGINARDVKYLLEGEQTQHMEQLAIEKFLREWEPPPDRYAEYLTAEELCRQSGLSLGDLHKLEDCRLLVPDTRDSLYLPKLVSWAKKLDFLMKAGWELEDIKRWARERFKSKYPKQWPPIMQDWIA